MVRYLYYENGICPDCGVNKLHNRETKCYECRSALARERYRKKRLAAGKSYNPTGPRGPALEPRRQDGLCPHCGKRPKLKKHAYCQQCHNELGKTYYYKHHDELLTQRKTRSVKRVNDPNYVPKYRNGNLCPRCGIRERLPKHGYCRECKQELWKDWYHQHHLTIDKPQATKLGKHYRKDGICPKCGERPRAPQRGYCKECSRQYRKQYLDTHSRHGNLPGFYCEPTPKDNLCPVCHQHPVVKGISLCESCHAQKRDQLRLIRSRRYRISKRYNRTDGICPKCGERPRLKYFGYCQICNVANATRQHHLRKTRTSENKTPRRFDGICPQCGERPVIPHGSYCRECHRERTRKAYQRLRARFRAEQAYHLQLELGI